MNKLNYKTEHINITKDSIERFQILGNRRKINKTVVNNLLRLLKDGDHFETPIMCNRIGHQYRLLDGNHRLEALRLYFEHEPEGSVEILACVYHNLNPDMEKEMYNKWNKGKKQSLNDYLQQYKEEMELWAILQREFPCNVTIYSPHKAIRFQTLLIGYNSGMADDFDGGRPMSPDKFKDWVINLENPSQIYKTMVEFMEDFQYCFGNVDKNSYTKTAVFYSLFRIWLDNKPFFDRDVLRKRFRNKLFNHTDLLSVKGGGTGATIEIHERFIDILNKGIHKKNNLFKIKATDTDGTLRMMSPYQVRSLKY